MCYYHIINSMKDVLKKLGLTDKEIDIYLMLLSIGEATASNLAYRTGIAKNSCRYICEQLLEKKLISLKKRGNMFIYKADPPEKMMFLLEEEERKIQDKKEGFNRILGDLINLSNPENTLPKIRFYNGYDGIKDSYRDMISECKGKEMMAIFSVVENVGVELQEFFLKEYVPSRVEKEIFMKNICLDSPKGIKYKQNDKRDLRETKVVSSKLFPVINTEINLYDNSMHYMSFDTKDSFAMIVQDTYITSMLKAVFTIIWNNHKILET